MAEERFNLITVGGGPGGYVAAIKAAQFGLKVALVEKDKVGGACLHRGCIPTKSLLHSAHLYQLCKRSQEYGIHVDNVSLDFSLFHKRKEAVVGRLFQGVKFLLKKNSVEVFEGTGRLLSPTKVSIQKDGKDVNEIEADNVMLATGSSPVIFKGIPYDKKNVLTSDDILSFPSSSLGTSQIPKSIIIAGGGAVGVEFAYLYNAIGSQVTIIELMEHILPPEDKEVSETLEKIFSKRGINILTSTSLEKVNIKNDGVEVEVKGKSIVGAGFKPAPTLKAQKLLLALGRKPATEDIRIEDLQLEFDGKFIKVDDHMETSQPGLFAIGDLTGPPLLAHAASTEGILAVSHIAGKETSPINYNAIPAVTFSHPQVASVGLTQQVAETQGHKIKVGKFPLMANSKAIISGEDEGFIKIVSDTQYGEILGVHIIGADAGELVGGMSLAMSLEATALDLSWNIYPHPTLSEIIHEAAHAVEGKAIHF
ncbi:MAG TPA: dihydrolipoyl dehydrogenase [Candidatus Brocadiia bacterium]|nr:dihydrolipoyl dehydrogenase [Candidatus Brocadiales bacterium]